jgi:transposase
MHQIRVSGDKRPVFYLDKTWVNQYHTLKYIWQDSTSNGRLKVPVGKGSQLIVCHVGSALTGFIPESKWVFRSKSTKDYHEKMMADTFKYWFLNRFINYLEEGSIIIIDDASYYSVTLNKVPHNSAKKQDTLIGWNRNKFTFSNNNNKKTELLKRVLPFRHDTKMYELDQLASERGHQMIQLPLYHCHYNPIELVWAQVKR